MENGFLQLMQVQISNNGQFSASPYTKIMDKPIMKTSNP